MAYTIKYRKEAEKILMKEFYFPSIAELSLMDDIKGNKELNERLDRTFIEQHGNHETKTN